MTKKFILKQIDTIQTLIRIKNSEEAIILSKPLIDFYIAKNHYTASKIKLKAHSHKQIQQLEFLLNLIKEKPELKKIIGKKTIKEAIKWYDKFEIILSDDTSAKKKLQFAREAVLLISHLILMHHKTEKYFTK